jgi:hypothetical protein
MAMLSLHAIGGFLFLIVVIWQRAIFSIAHVDGQSHKPTLFIIKFDHVAMCLAEIAPLRTQGRERIRVTSDSMLYGAVFGVRNHHPDLAFPVVEFVTQAAHRKLPAACRIKFA